MRPLNYRIRYVSSRWLAAGTLGLSCIAGGCSEIPTVMSPAAGARLRPPITTDTSENVMLVGDPALASVRASLLRQLDDPTRAGQWRLRWHSGAHDFGSVAELSNWLNPPGRLSVQGSVTGPAANGDVEDPIDPDAALDVMSTVSLMDGLVFTSSRTSLIAARIYATATGHWRFTDIAGSTREILPSPVVTCDMFLTTFCPASTFDWRVPHCGVSQQSLSATVRGFHYANWAYTQSQHSSSGDDQVDCPPPEPPPSGGGSTDPDVDFPTIPSPTYCLITEISWDDGETWEVIDFSCN